MDELTSTPGESTPDESTPDEIEVFRWCYRCGERELPDEYKWYETDCPTCQQAGL